MFLEISEGIFHPDFLVELRQLASDAKVNLVSTVNFLKEFSPTLGRPHLDTLNGSSFSNMKEIRFSSASGIWRASKSIAYQLGNLA